MSAGPSKILLEVCVESADGATAAERGGADRVELCAALSEGGLTPSVGAIHETRARTKLPIVVLVRPRAGDFLFSDVEFETMTRDIEAAREARADGVAAGLLLANGDVDVARMRRLVDAARPMPVTFHRAFDLTRDPLRTLDALIDLGIARVLTSGQERSAVDGASLIRKLVDHAAGRISVMAGGGVREENVRDLVATTGVREVHASASGGARSAMTHRNPRPAMGGTSAATEYEHRITDEARVRRLVEALASVRAPDP